MELTADSVRAEPLLRFYQKQCGLSYMYSRLRKELLPPPPRLAPLPFPFQAQAAVVAAEGAVAGGGCGYADLDFASSFCLLSSPSLGLASYARFTLDGGCTLHKPATASHPSTAAHQFWLTNSCIGEDMYRQSDLVSQPPGVFSVIYEDEGTFVFDKRYADPGSDARTLSQAPPTCE